MENYQNLIKKVEEEGLPLGVTDKILLKECLKESPDVDVALIRYKGYLPGYCHIKGTRSLYENELIQ